MPIGYSSTVKTALAQPVFRPRLLVQIEGVKRWSSERGRDLTWDSQTWTGDAPVISIAGGSDTMAPESHSLQITLSAASPDLLALSFPFLAKVRIYRVFLDADLDIIPDPKLVYEERVDFVSYHPGDQPHIVVNCENFGILMAQSAPRLRTHNDHIDEFPGDTFYKYTARLVENPLHVLVGYRPPMSV